MTAGATGPTAAAAPRRRAQDASMQDVTVAAVLVVILAVVGVLLGLVWQVWSPARPAAEVLGGGKFIPDEGESFIAGDGRFLALTAAVGLIAGLAAWFLRPANRGVAVAGGLVVGGLAGALLTEWVGRLTGGGSATGRVVTGADGQRFRLTDHLPLSLHMQGVILLEAAVAALVYGLFVAFTAHDDLGRPDPVRDELLAVRQAQPAESSVHAGGHPQYGGGYRDGAGPAQQGDLPPQ